MSQTCPYQSYWMKQAVLFGIASILGYFLSYSNCEILRPKLFNPSTQKSYPKTINCFDFAEYSKWCSCTLLKFDKIGIFCDQADSLEDIIFMLTPINFPIDTLSITNTHIPTLKNYVFQNLIVRRLVLSNNTLADLEPNCFSNSPLANIPYIRTKQLSILDTLEELEISWNLLTHIPINGIKDLRSLNSLQLINNQIITIPNYTFLQFQSRYILETMDLSSNQMSWLAENCLLGLEGLKKLSLDKNQFTTIPTKALQQVGNSLEELWMSVNLIERIAEEDNLNLPKLKSLSLDVNRLQQISGEFFRETSNLLYLYLSNNAFTEINSEMFQKISKLKVLSMNNNMISTLSQKSFEYIPSLIRLELANCLINHVDEGTFWAIPNIQVITISGNKITKRMFSSLPFLVALDLQKNMISDVEDFTFNNLNSLQILDLSRNNLEKLRPNTFYNTFEKRPRNGHNLMARVLNLYVTENPWICNEQIIWFLKWLNENPDIQINSPGNAPASCTKPYYLKNKPLRSVTLEDIYSQTTTPTTTTQKPKSFTITIPEQQNKIVEKIKEVDTATSLTSIKTINKTIIDQLNQRKSTKSDTSISWLIIIITCACALIVVLTLISLRILYFKKRKTKKTTKIPKLPHLKSTSKAYVVRRENPLSFVTPQHFVPLNPINQRSQTKTPVNNISTTHFYDSNNKPSDKTDGKSILKEKGNESYWWF